jgi:hypothetical protein
MSGAGSATLAFDEESSFLGSPSDSSGFISFGRNPTVQDLSIDNQLTRLREAGKIQSVESLKGNFEGAFGVEAVINAETFSQVESLIFNDGGTGLKTGRPQSAVVRVGVEYLDSAGTATDVRELSGVIPTDFSVDYSQGEPLTYSATFLYADESDSSEPASVTRPAGGADAAFHSFGLDIDGATVSKLQSASLSLSNLSRFHYGADPTPVDATLAAPEVTLDAEAIYEGPDRLDLAYGGASSPQDRVGGVSATVDISVNGTAVSTYTLPTVTPDSYSWESLLDADSDTADSTTFNVDGQVSVA